MSTKTEPTKSQEFAERHNLDELLVVNDRGTFEQEQLKDLHEKVLLLDAGMTYDQFKKGEKVTNELFNAVAYVGAGKAHAALKNNPDLSEVSLSYAIGSMQTASFMFSRDKANPFVAAVETKVKNAEFKRVTAYIDNLFDDINT